MRRARPLAAAFLLLAACRDGGAPRPAHRRMLAARRAERRAREAAEAAEKALAGEKAALEALANSLLTPAPADTPFLFVDIDHRRVVYYENGRLARVCEASVGSGRLIRGERRDWKFDTPRGRFAVLGKLKDPIWYKPDWAFVEKREEIPPLSSPLRREKGAMGPFALDLGDGYKIHGTREEGKIGAPVSHGCIRLETECIADFYERIPNGTPVFMF